MSETADISRKDELEYKQGIVGELNNGSYESVKEAHIVDERLVVYTEPGEYASFVGTLPSGVSIKESGNRCVELEINKWGKQEIRKSN